MTWLVTGGAGYIGAHVVRALADAGREVVVLDDLSSGLEHRLPAGTDLVVGSVLDRNVLDALFQRTEFHGVVHLAGKKQVAESVADPLRYYHENVEGLRVLLDAMVRSGVGRLVFSSSASVYGMPDVDRVTEHTPCDPLSPYGETKLIGERMIAAAARAHGISHVSIRYFNVAGAGDPTLGDAGRTNLIPMVLERITSGQPALVFGDDYPTPDGTCIRDYIHVADLATAHAAAAARLDGDAVALTLNAGRGEGSSVHEVIAMIKEVTGIDARTEVTARRPGDPASVVACAEAIEGELGWRAQYDLRSMVKSAWAAWGDGAAARAGEPRSRS